MTAQAALRVVVRVHRSRRRDDVASLARCAYLCATRSCAIIMPTSNANSHAPWNAMASP
jgi:hypothetical protein